MIVQLNPQVPIITPLGKAWAVALLDYSQDHDLFWIAFQDDTGECWTWRNQDIKAQKNITIGRSMSKKVTPIKVEKELKKHEKKDEKMERAMKMEMKKKKK